MALRTTTAMPVTGSAPRRPRPWTPPVPATPSTVRWRQCFRGIRTDSRRASGSPPVSQPYPPNARAPRARCRPGPRSRSTTGNCECELFALSWSGFRPQALLPMPRINLLAAAILGGFSVLPAYAQDQVTDFDKVTVSASTSRLPDSEAALPNTITVITAEQLQEQLAVTRDLSQVLANLIPAFAPSRQKMSSFGESLRGRQPLYMVDGVPQSTPLRDGSRDAHTIDPAMIERIEVIHGANALQGLGASGGIINIITRRAPRRDGSFHEVTLGASTALPRRDDGAGYRGSWLFGTRKGAFDFVGGASYAQEGLYYDGDGKAIAIDPVQGDLMDARSLSLFGKAGWDLGDARRLQLSVNRYRLRGDGDYLNLPRDFANGETATSVPGEPPLDPPQNDSTTVSLDYSDFALAGGYLQAQLYWTRFDARYGAFRYVDFFNEGTDDTWFDQTNIGAEKHGAKFTWSRSDIA